MGYNFAISFEVLHKNDASLNMDLRFRTLLRDYMVYSTLITDRIKKKGEK